MGVTRLLTPCFSPLTIPYGLLIRRQNKFDCQCLFSQEGDFRFVFAFPLALQWTEIDLSRCPETRSECIFSILDNAEPSLWLWLNMKNMRSERKQKHYLPNKPDNSWVIYCLRSKTSPVLVCFIFQKMFSQFCTTNISSLYLWYLNFWGLLTFCIPML